MSRLARMSLALLLCAAAACSDDSTSFFLRVTGVDGATQLSVRGIRDGSTWFGPELRPENEGAAFSGEQTLRIRFNTPPGAPVLIRVEALAGGEPIAEGEAEATPLKGEEVELRIALSRVNPGPGTDGGTDAGTDGGTPDAGEPDAGDPDAGEPDAGPPDAGQPDAGAPDGGSTGCSSVNCAGCCGDDGVCVTNTSARACGKSGSRCEECSQERANTCTADGFCSCGTRGNACEVGQRCNGSTCTCDPDLCPGCCQGAECRTGNTMSACDTGADTCAVCSDTNADNCSNGGCRCGTGPACSGLAGRCRNGGCSL